MANEKKNKEEVLVDLITPAKAKTGSILKSNSYDTIPKITRNVINPLLLLLKGAKAETEDIVATAFTSGMYLSDEPFIPEYMGFNETIIESDIADARVYTKDNFILCKNRSEFTEKGKDKWIVKNTTTNTFSVHSIDNMLEATIILKSLGLDTCILDVVGCKDVILS